MYKIKFITCFCLSLGIPIFSALSQTATYDFENVSAEGTEFIIGQSPTSLHVINFTLETVENTALAHSGTKALVLVPGATEGCLLPRGRVGRPAVLHYSVERHVADWHDGYSF